MTTTDIMQTGATAHDADAERSILGQLILRPEGIFEIRATLAPTDFYSPKHEAIYDGLLRLNTAGDPIDLLTLNASLAASGTLAAAGGAGYVAEVSNAYGGEVGWCADRVAECARKRAVTRVAVQLLQNMASNITALEGSHQAQVALDAVALGDAAVTRTIEDTDANARYRASLDADAETTISTGLSDLDDVLEHGFYDGQMTLVAGRMGVGKTVALAGFAMDASYSQGKRGLFVSIEMIEKTLMKRMTAARLTIPLTRLNGGKDEVKGLTEGDWLKIFKDEAAWEAAGGHPSGGSIVIMTPQSHGEITIDLIVSEAQRLARDVAAGGLDYIVIDYLTRIKPARGGNTLERKDTVIGEIAEQLVSLAIQLNIPVIVAAQLNRGAAGSLPKVEHLAESDIPARHADVILLLHDPAESGDPRPGELDILVEKNRNGAHGVTVPVASLMHYQRLDNLAQDWSATA